MAYKIRGVQWRPTEVLDAYWRFAAERQEVYFARLSGIAPPWTEDNVLARFRFTNAYRAADRVSQFLIRHVIYVDDTAFNAEDVLFRVILFKLFNRIETWRLLEDRLGPILWSSFSADRFGRVLDQAMRAGRAIYSPAYVMPPPTTFGYTRKHRNHLALLELMMRESLCCRITKAASMEAVYELLRAYPSIGPFLAYQLTIDLNYSDLTEFSENDFVVAGPGAIDGIRKAFVNTGGLTDAEVIRLMVDIQQSEFSRLGLKFRSLHGRPLHLVDCQNLFCEIGKYARVAYPECHGALRRSRIKQVFRTEGRDQLPPPWFPPKWQINTNLVERWNSGEEEVWS